MWTEITRPKYERKCLGYSSNLSDAEWTTIEPLLPQCNRLGRPPKTSSSAGVIDSESVKTTEAAEGVNSVGTIPPSRRCGARF